MSIFSICGFPEIEQFKPLNDTFKAIARNSHKPLIASIFRPGAESFTAPPYRSYLENVLKSLEHAGRNLVELVEIPKMTLKCISSDYGVSKEKWLTYSNLRFIRNLSTFKLRVVDKLVQSESDKRKQKGTWGCPLQAYCITDSV